MKINISLDTAIYIGGCLSIITFIYHKKNNSKLFSYKKTVSFDRNLQIKYIPLLDKNDINKHNLFYTVDDIDQFKRDRYNSYYDDEYEYV